MMAGEGAPQRQLHRFELVLVPVQFLAVAGDHQQRVVGARAEHHHVEDAGGQTVDREAAVPREQVDHALGDLQGDTRAQHRHDPQRRAAIDDQQDDDDHDTGGEQQGAVDVGERLIAVGGLPGRAGHISAQAVTVLGRAFDDRPDIGHVIVEFRFAGVADAYDDLHRLAVRRDDRTERLLARCRPGQPDGDVTAIDLGQVRLRGGDVGGGDAGIPGVQDDRECAVGVVELGGQIQRPRRFGIGREIGRLVVGLRVGQFARERYGDCDQDDPDGGEQPPRPAPGRRRHQVGSTDHPSPPCRSARPGGWPEPLASRDSQATVWHRASRGRNRRALRDP